MSGWASTIKIGKVGSEIEIALDDIEDVMSGFTGVVGNEQASVQNLNRETFTVLFRRMATEYSISFDDAREELAWALQSLSLHPTQELTFIFADAWKIYSTPYITTGTTIQLKTTPQLRLDQAYYAKSLSATMRINGVYAAYSAWGSQASGNLYTSYNRATGVITHTSVTAGTELYVNWDYDGVLAKILPPGIRAVVSEAIEGGVNRAHISFTMRGV